MPSPEKFRETLVEYEVDEDTILKINKGFENITSKTPKKKKADFFSQALCIIENELGEAKTQEIFRANGCCKTGARLKNSKEFARINESISLEEKLSKIRKAHYMNMGSPELLENGDILVHAVSYILDGKYACACPTISKQETQPKNKNVNDTIVVKEDVLNPFIDNITLLMILTLAVFKIIVITIRTYAKFATKPS